MASSQVSAAISAFIYFFFFFSLGEVECVVAVKNCIMEHLGRIWAIADFLAPPLGNWDVTRECYTKYSSNYWQLMIVVTGKAVCVRNQLPTGCLVLLNPPWPPPALPSFWKFVRPCLAFAPRGRGGPYMKFTAAKSGLDLLRFAIKTKPEISRSLPLWSSGLAVDCVTEFACHYLICSKQSQGFRTLLFPFDESAIWQAIYLFTVCQCRYNSSNFIIFHKGRYKYLRKPLVLINRGNIVFRWETIAAAQDGYSIWRSFFSTKKLPDFKLLEIVGKGANNFMWTKTFWFWSIKIFNFLKKLCYHF